MFTIPAVLSVFLLLGTGLLTATPGREGAGMEASPVFKLLSSCTSLFLLGFQTFQLLNSLQTLIFIPAKAVMLVRTGDSPVLPMRKLRQ